MCNGFPFPFSFPNLCDPEVDKSETNEFIEDTQEIKIPEDVMKRLNDDESIFCDCGEFRKEAKNWAGGIEFTYCRRCKKEVL